MNINSPILRIKVLFCTAILMWFMPLSSAKSENAVSSIAITGKTNINTFQLTQQLSTINFTASPLGSDYIRFAIPVKTFSADNSHIYNDFVELLKGDRHPYIYIDIAINNLRSIRSNKNHQLVHLYLTITDISRPFEVETNIQLNGNGSLTLTGQRNIHLPDFSIEPPVKFMGLVKVNNDINILFKLSFLLNHLSLIP